MNPITPYLNFGGKCAEAMAFYAGILDAETSLQTVGESPIAGQCPAAIHGQVMHASLTRNGVLLLMASDMVGQEGLQPGNNMSLSFNCSSEKEINHLFDALSAGGQVQEKLQKQFWGALFGAFTDRYGIRWMLQYAEPQSTPPAQEPFAFSVNINATRERVWEVLFADEYYRQWTAPFHPGSYAESDWQEGSKALFKSPEGDGLIARVAKHKPAEHISFEYTGLLQKGVEVYDDPEFAKWHGATENYTVRDEADGTRLDILMDGPSESLEHMRPAWEKALVILVQLAEAQPVTA